MLHRKVDDDTVRQGLPKVQSKKSLQTIG